MNQDGSSRINLTNTSDLVEGRPAWSPDGSKLVFYGETAPGSHLDIFTINADGSGLFNVTNTPTSGEAEPAWSPDGSQIVFTSDRYGGSQIFVMNADGTGSATQLTIAGGTNNHPVWSPDGLKIAFMSTRAGSDDVWVMNANGAGQVNLTELSAGNDGLPDWSPDGSLITFFSTRESPNGEIYVMGADGSAQTRLTFLETHSLAPVFSPDGSQIAFESFDGGDWEILRVPAIGGVPAPVTNNDLGDNDPDWRPVAGSLNAPPTADAGGPYAVDEGASVQLDGSGSSDPDQAANTLTYGWDLDNDSTFETPGQIVSFDASNRDGPATQDVALEVCDAANACDTDAVEVTVDNVAPTIDSINFESPINQGGSSSIAVDASDPAAADVLTYKFDCDDDLVFETAQPGDTASCTFPNAGTFEVNVQVDDDDGGSSATQTVAIVVEDVTAPTTTASLAGTAGATPWFLSDVQVTLDAMDNPGGEGVQKITYDAGGGPQDAAGDRAQLTLTAEGVTTVTFFATDNAGNAEAPQAIGVPIDKSDPTISASVSPPANGNGWHNGPVVIDFDCQDAVSGVASCLGDTTLSGDGAGQVVTGTATDNAGRTAPAAVTVNIDAGAPTCSVSADPGVLTPPNHKTKTVDLAVAGDDGLSGVAGITLVSVVSDEPDNGLGDGDQPNDIEVVGDTQVKLRAERAGSGDGRTYTLTYAVTDQAGNVGSCAAVVTVPDNRGA